MHDDRPLFPKGLRVGYPWLAEKHPKAGTPPQGTPLRSNDIEARINAQPPFTGKLADDE